MIGTLWLAAMLHHRVAAHHHCVAEGVGVGLRRVVHADELGARHAMLEHRDGRHRVEPEALRKAHDLVAELVTVLGLEHRGIATGQHQNASRAPTEPCACNVDGP